MSQPLKGRGSKPSPTAYRLPAWKTNYPWGGLIWATGCADMTFAAAVEKRTCSLYKIRMARAGDRCNGSAELEELGVAEVSSDERIR
jgi:hypothetical protein